VKSPKISISFQKLATSQCIATICGIVVWSLGVIICGYGTKIMVTGVVVAGTLFVVSIIALLLFSPEKQRPIGTLATLWSVTSFVRFLAALGASSLLYYVAQFGLRPLMFSFLLTAVFLLIAETKALSKMLAEYSPTTTD